MTTYILFLNGTAETFQVPQGKKVYLVRAPQVSTGTATVRDLNTGTTYTLQDGVTVLDTGIAEGTTVQLQLVATTNPQLQFVNAEVTYPRT